jgi:4'-phosphopantetheinyl transferase
LTAELAATYLVRDPFPANPVLSGDDVHVIRLDLANEAGGATLLDPAERARAGRFRDDRHRRAFVAAHAATRIALGRCCGAPPAALRFAYGTHGKPQLIGWPEIRFNLAHTGDRAMLAIAAGREVGIDIERERPIDVLDIARRFFSSLEQSALAATPANQRLAAFFRCWTRKESFIKAGGDGLSRSLSAFDMSLDEHGASVLLACRDVPDDALRWTTIPIRVDAGYAAALTVEGPRPRLLEWQGL